MQVYVSGSGASKAHGWGREWFEHNFNSNKADTFLQIQPDIYLIRYFDVYQVSLYIFAICAVLTYHTGSLTYKQQVQTYSNTTHQNI